MTDTSLTDALQGVVGSQVVLTVERPGTRNETDIPITRGMVLVPAVDWAMVPGTRIAVIRLAIFSDGAARELEAALDQVHGSGATGLVLDLRGNPGGMVSEAIDVASELLVSGSVFQIRDAAGTVTAVPVDGGLMDARIPLVVLIDAETWSAAEVVASALHDAGRARLVGQRTAGTGTLLRAFSLDDGSKLQIGIWEWLTRNGASVWHMGVVPDESVAIPTGKTPLTPSDLADLGVGGPQSSGDTQLATAVQLLAIEAR